MHRKIHRKNDRTNVDPSLSGNGAQGYSTKIERGPINLSNGLEDNKDKLFNVIYIFKQPSSCINISHVWDEINFLSYLDVINT